MPNQSQSGWTGDPWSRCDRCGCDFHVSQLRRQNGLLVCSDDYDDPIGEQRQQIIAEILADATEEAGVAEILKGQDNESNLPQV